MKNAEIIVQKFGGQSALAQLIGKGQSTVQYWVNSGVIPAKWQPKLLALAADRGVPLTADEFIQAQPNGPTASLGHTTITAAARSVLRDKGPSTLHELFNEIVGRQLYLFNTDDPLGVLKGQLRKHCQNFDFPSASPVKYFALDPQTKKWANLEKALRVSGKKGRTNTKHSPELLLNKVRMAHSEYVSGFRDTLLARIRRLDVNTFGLFAKKLLEIYGIDKIEIEPTTQNGTVNGHGKLKVGLAHLSVAFECKNWRAGTVGKTEIDKLRGATQGQYEQAVLFTTASFSSEATQASFRPGAIPVVLIDGPGIIDIMFEKRFGIEVETLPIYRYALDLAIEEEAEVESS